MNSLIHSLGIMQGRLLPKYQGRYQAHPVGYWEKEFPVAASLGFDYIEFILDYNDADINPLLTDAGPDQIQDIAGQSKVGVRSVCADYFMEAPLHHASEEIAARSVDVLKRLMHHGSRIGIRDIVIPCVDQSSMRDDAASERFIRQLTPLQDLAEKLDVNLSLETDLAPQPFAALLDRFSSKKITVNYDTGNSASLGFDVTEEFACYGQRISDIHIKDRVLKGGSVFLGTGDADFGSFFKALALIDYEGPFIMQAFRDDEGVEICRQQIDWLNSHFL